MNYISDLFIAILISVMIFSLFSNFMSERSQSMTDFMSENEIETIGWASLDKLISSPGNPKNWEKLDNINDISPGLANLDNDLNPIPNEISFIKLIKLKENYDVLSKKILKEHIKSELIVKPIGVNIGEIKMQNGILNENNDLYIFNRTVRCDFLSYFSILIFYDNSDELSNEFDLFKDSCNHESANPHKKLENQIWICNKFTSNTETMNYYLISDNELMNVEWILDNNDMILNEENSIGKTAIYLNPYIDSLNSSNVNWLHIKMKKGEKNKVHLLEIPKNVQINSNFEYYKKADCNIILKLWID